MSKGSEQAFPVEKMSKSMGGNLGLTKREYFAGLAMQGLLANPNQDLVDLGHEVMSAVAMDAADALLAELAK